MSKMNPLGEEITPLGKVAVTILIVVILVFVVFPLAGYPLVDTSTPEPDNYFIVDYHDNETADVRFNMPNERLYTEDIIINGQSATRVYDNPPELLPVNQSARIDVSNTDRIVITHNGYVIYENPVPENISNA